MMGEKNTDDQWEDVVNAMKNSHNPPPETPRDRMWERIDAARAPRRGKVARPDFQAGRGPAFHRVWGLVAAAAAVLVLGVAIGRWTGSPGGPTAPVAVTSPVATVTTQIPAGNDLLYRKAADDLFGRADALLTNFKVTACADQDLQTMPSWAGGMLLQTRLLMETPVGRDPETRALLMDLELVLAQIAGISQNNCARDVAWIRDAMTEQATIDRLRLARPVSAAGRPL
jgi:hypothetical protein